MKIRVNIWDGKHYNEKVYRFDRMQQLRDDILELYIDEETP